MKTEQLTPEQIALYNILLSEEGEVVNMGSIFAEMADRYGKQINSKESQYV
jgi:hypothetical protein